MTTDYHCAVCNEPIADDEDPHTDVPTGGDCHEACCSFCALEVFMTERGLTRDDIEEMLNIGAGAP